MVSHPNGHIDMQSLECGKALSNIITLIQHAIFAYSRKYLKVGLRKSTYLNYFERALSLQVY